MSNIPYDASAPTRDEVDAFKGLTVLEFGAPWCPHCQAGRPLLEAALAKHPDVRHLAVEDGKGKPLGRSFTVKVWPTYVLLRDGVEQNRLVRPTSGQDVAEAVGKLVAG